ncbi:MAG: phosphatidate cytidylyltransferase [Rhizobiaceae bacterium]
MSGGGKSGESSHKGESAVSGFMASELGKRVASGIVMLVAVLWLCWLGGWPFTLLSLLLSALLYYEWQAIVRRTPFDGIEAVLTAGFVGLLISNLFGYGFVGLAVFAVLGLLLELTTSGDEKSDVRWIGLGALYCAIPAIAFPLIRDNGGLALILFLFVTVWITDIAAYFVGRQFGGPKLMPAVSPKKTWSGALGGLGFSVLFAIAVTLYDASLPTLALILGAVLLSIVSQAGDLFESWVKRLFDVKDSSQLIPGHGGFLDRLDGLVAAAVPVALLVALGSGG